MEPIAHLEWTLGISLICLAFLDVQINALGFLLIGIGSVFPDIFDLIIFHGKKFMTGHREFSHTILFVLILSSIAYFIPILGYLAFGSILHIFEDIVAGRDPVYLFSPFTHKGALMLITKNQSIQIGAKVRRFIKGAFTGSENIGDELSWFWFLTILGSWLLIAGIFFYFR
ncbi:MAG: metal-dependent hydrolase [Candidatus Hermodarchaeota archaeon]